MKKLFTFVFVALFSLTLADFTYASENTSNDLNLDLSNSKIIYQDEEITVGSFGNDPDIAKKIEESPTSVTNFEAVPYLTATGPGGKATLDAGANGRTIYWSVKPATSWPWTFKGNIGLRYYSGFKRDVTILGAGALGSSDSGYVYMNPNNGGRASLTGTAYAVNNSYYKVMPGVSVGF
ncbi:hypothetical protein PDN13_31935 [Bacillus cereus]|nr:hypothetical protein [Bacillus cereus]